MIYAPRDPLEKLYSDCQAVIERCRNQRVTLVLEKEHIRGAALLRDHEPKLRRQMERVVRRLLATVPEKVN